MLRINIPTKFPSNKHARCYLNHGKKKWKKETRKRTRILWELKRVVSKISEQREVGEICWETGTKFPSSGNDSTNRFDNWILRQRKRFQNITNTLPLHFRRPRDFTGTRALFFTCRSINQILLPSLPGGLSTWMLLPGHAWKVYDPSIPFKSNFPMQTTHVSRVFGDVFLFHIVAPTSFARFVFSWHLQERVICKIYWRALCVLHTNGNEPTQKGSRGEFEARYVLITYSRGNDLSFSTFHCFLEFSSRRSISDMCFPMNETRAFDFFLWYSSLLSITRSGSQLQIWLVLYARSF